MAHGKRTPVELVQQSDHPDVVATFERIKAKTGIANIHRTVANSPPVFLRFLDMAYALRHDTLIDPVERELAICCVLERHQGDYELAPHRRFALALGASEEQVANVRNPAAHALYTERQRAVLRFAERFAADPSERDRLEESGIENYLNSRERVELAMNLALYLGMAHFTGVLDVPDESTSFLQTMKAPK